jgi:hypothetical protein
MYLIDSDVLIDAKNRHYGFDFVPAFWDWITQQHQAGRVFTVQKVADEVLEGADELAQWMRIQPASFRIAAGPSDQVSLRAVAQWAANAHFTQGAVSDFLQKADYYLAGQAATLGYTVVTQETSDLTSKKRVKIPDACSAVGVSSITPFNMLRAEKVRFVL